MARLTLNRGEAAGVALAGLAVLALPPLMLGVRSVPDEPARLVRAGKPPTAPPAPPLDAAFERPLFVASAPVPVAEPDAAAADGFDRPELVGIAGRLNRDAVALVRSADGGTRTLSVGDSVDGWRLESLAIDAALFVRGGERARVALPEG